MNEIRIDYRTYRADAGSLLDEYKIGREHLSEADRSKVVAYLEKVLHGGSAEPWAFTLKGVTVTGQGIDEASYFYGHLR